MENHIGTNLKQYREQLGLTQEEFASYLNVSREQVSYYETGARSIPSNILTKAAAIFGIDEHDLYEEDLLKKRASLVLAFRANELSQSDMEAIAGFKRIVINYLQMKKIASYEFSVGEKGK